MLCLADCLVSVKWRCGTVLWRDDMDLVDLGRFTHSEDGIGGISNTHMAGFFLFVKPAFDSWSRSD